MQDRLEREQHDNQTEKARLHSLVEKLENQLTEQAQLLEQVLINKITITILFGKKSLKWKKHLKKHDTLWKRYAMNIDVYFGELKID